MRVAKARGFFILERYNYEWHYGIPSAIEYVYSDDTVKMGCGGFMCAGKTPADAKRNFWEEWKNTCKRSLGYSVFLEQKIRCNGSTILEVR